MTKIFMSYRREDSSLEAEFIRDRLVRKMKNTEVFYDLDSVSVGRDFKKQIDHFVAAADFFLALIGGSWLTVNDANGQRRLDDPGDFVRLEIESALQRGMPIIPVLLNGAHMPEAAQLPDSLRGLVACKPHLVRLPPDFKPDVNELARMLIGLDRNRRERLNASNGPTAAPAQRGVALARSASEHCRIGGPFSDGSRNHLAQPRHLCRDRQAACHRLACRSRFRSAV